MCSVNKWTGFTNGLQLEGSLLPLGNCMGQLTKPGTKGLQTIRDVQQQTNNKETRRDNKFYVVN